MDRDEDAALPAGLGLVFTRGLARLLSLVRAGAPSSGDLGGLVMGLGVATCLVLWQAMATQQRL
ncbi:hypothetical protein CCR86_14515 [Afifella marina]|nr:hypothetical protein [Afifella marina]